MTTQPDCDNLDAFLSDALAAADSARFAAHIESCHECRHAADQQQWMDGLLRSQVRAEFEPAPDRLIASVQSAIALSRQRAGLFVYGLAAAMLLLAGGWIALGHNRAKESIRPGATQIAEDYDPGAKNRIVVATAQSKATVITGPEAIVVPIDSPYPDVTIVRIYPTYEPNFTAQTNISPSPADNEFTWPANYDGDTL
jgi:anti-sigma factor RsiW